MAFFCQNYNCKHEEHHSQINEYAEFLSRAAVEAANLPRNINEIIQQTVNRVTDERFDDIYRKKNIIVTGTEEQNRDEDMIKDMYDFFVSPSCEL